MRTKQQGLALYLRQRPGQTQGFRPLAEARLLLLQGICSKIAASL